jgi:hypothetical protein
MTDAPGLTDVELMLLIIERDTCHYKKERIDELLNQIGEAKGFEDATNGSKASEAKVELAAVKEETFTILKFEAKQGAKLGEFDIAYKTSNLEDKWHHAYNILRNSNATINSRYHGQGYQFSYWLFGADKIYRQELKPKA